MRALVVSILMPNASEVERSWQRQMGLVSTRLAREGQHSFSGTVELLPCSTKVRHGVRFRSGVLQSIPATAGEGAATAGEGAATGGRVGGGSGERGRVAGMVVNMRRKMRE